MPVTESESALLERIAALEARVSELGSAVETVVTQVLPHMSERIRGVKELVSGGGKRRRAAASVPVRANWKDWDRAVRLYADGYRSFGDVSRLTGIPYSTVRRYCRMSAEEISVLKARHDRDVPDIAPDIEDGADAGEA
ncbi:MAG: hypothetical protein LBR80_01675 [Deltaproteobacteria bacterium]|jgi:hypothetical protein|nr:hypothetical protein [Deltaproteobacteria bacterium]